MKSIFKSSLLHFLLFSFSVLTIQAWATPSASDLLQTAKKQTHLNCATQHVIYRSTTIMQKPGQAPVTMVQTTELYKKKSTTGSGPGSLRMIMDDGINKKDVISNGDGYLYVLNPTNGKYEPIKAPIQIDPFQEMNNTLSDFDTATSQAVTDASDPPGGHYEITVKGGKMSKLMDHATMKIDPTTKVVTHMEGKDKSGNNVFLMDATYKNINGTYHPQRTHTEAHSGKYDVTSDMDVLTNDVDQGIPDSTFSIK